MQVRSGINIIWNIFECCSGQVCSAMTKENHTGLNGVNVDLIDSSVRFFIIYLCPVNSLPRSPGVQSRHIVLLIERQKDKDRAVWCM